MPGQRQRPRPPDFLIIGAQRCGTASLFDALMAHPRMVAPPRREIHYFDLRYWRGARWYRRQFERPADTFSGESSPYYLFHPQVPTRVAADLPGVRIIVLLRDPIERAWSHHQLNLQTGRETLPFLEALAAEADRMAGLPAPRWPRRRQPHRDYSYAARGHYRPQLDRWQAAVGPEAMLVLGSSELFERPATAQARILDHIGLPDHPLPTPHRHRSAERLSPEIREAAAPFFVTDEPSLLSDYGVAFD
ncbi:MAG: sulfotransferase domain-containing protein [Actinomycetota bacterium]